MSSSRGLRQRTAALPPTAATREAAGGQMVPSSLSAAPGTSRCPNPMGIQRARSQAVSFEKPQGGWRMPRAALVGKGREPRRAATPLAPESSQLTTAPLTLTFYWHESNASRPGPSSCGIHRASSPSGPMGAPREISAPSPLQGGETPNSLTF